MTLSPSVRLSLCALLALPLLLASCSSGSSSSQNQHPQVMTTRMQDRIASSRKRMNDPNDRSVYDKAMRSSITKGKDTGGWLGRKSYKSNEYAGTKSFKAGEYKTGSFTQGDNKSRMGKQQFGERDKTPAYADNNFNTRESRFASQQARDGNRTFSGADDTFKTGSVRDALRSQEKNDRPKFIELEQQRKDPAYTEDQVRRLLGRD